MKSIYIILFFALCSCQVPEPQNSNRYLISEYDSMGKVENIYQVNDYNLLGDKVEFLTEGQKKLVGGSFKIEKIEN